MNDQAKLPPGKTCHDCVHFKPKCSWLIQAKPSNTVCDWSPSRLIPKVMR